MRLAVSLLLLLLLAASANAQTPAGIICAVAAAVQRVQPVIVAGWPYIPPSLLGDSLGAVARLLSWQSCATTGRTAEVVRRGIDAGGHVVRVTFDAPVGMQSGKDSPRTAGSWCSSAPCPMARYATRAD